VAKFRFKLQAVLDQRLAREQQRQLIVAQIERERVDAEQDIRAYQEAIERERDELRRMLSDERAAGEMEGAVQVDLSGARQQAAAAMKLTARAQQAVLKLAGIHRKLDAARLDLLKAATERKAAELLREKQYEEFKAEQRAKDAAIVDEIGTLKAARREEDSEAA
jgi:flagellar export protein FliJ